MVLAGREKQVHRVIVVPAFEVVRQPFGLDSSNDGAVSLRLVETDQAAHEPPGQEQNDLRHEEDRDEDRGLGRHRGQCPDNGKHDDADQDERALGNESCRPNSPG